ncbi:CBS domain-containing protein [Streptomyces hyaluromycini]|uniref:CBS domain-containing protein n=1 Tax=Streptomyces hyaluromycini TaxID=1377993 RepID=UPI000B5C44C0|nr:CBS domain-containing protein [Streptomyces hyaluromycini]
MTGTPHVVSDVMTHTVLALRHGAAFKDIVKAMQQWQVSAAPVLDDHGRVVGVVSEADLLRKEQARADAPGRPPEPDRTKARAVTAEELMTVPAITVHPGATLPEAARTMARHGVKRLPVVDADGLLRGVVSRADLLKVFLRDDEDIAEEIRREIVPHLFPDSAEPVRVRVRDGVVTLTGRVPDTALVPVATGWVRGVDGVVAVDCALAGPPRRPDLDPDLPDPQPAPPA